MEYVVRPIAARNCKNSESPWIRVTKRRKSMSAENIKRDAVMIETGSVARSEKRHIDIVVTREGQTCERFSQIP